MTVTELIESYKKHYAHLGEPTTGGTRVEHIERIMPAFVEIMGITKPDSLLEIGFNAGASALLFLTIDPELILDSVDIEVNDISKKYLLSEFYFFSVIEVDSNIIGPEWDYFQLSYDLVFIDGDHSREGVKYDIETSLTFKPKYILFDDIRHPSHSYIEEIITDDYADKLELIKIYEFNDIWEGYSFGLCKVKDDR